MIKTFYGLGTLDSSGALFLALTVGFFFGLVLESAGFGSSKRLSGVFYFRDMAVIKVMFTALLTGMLGLNIASGIGLIDPATQIYFIPTYYGAYVVAGLIFGIGFVMSGWCPGTGLVGLSSGKVDALVFLIGVVFGSILFNELFPILKPLYTWGLSAQNSLGQSGLAFVYTSLGVSKSNFIFFFTVMGIFFFYAVEIIEQKKPQIARPFYLNTPSFKAFCFGLLIIAGTLSIFSETESSVKAGNSIESESRLLADVEDARDHMDPETLAELLYNQAPSTHLVDVRTQNEFQHFHIRSAVNVSLPDLPAFMSGIPSSDTVVLYSNGMTHPVQARDSLSRLGFKNIYILTDGLAGFMERCLKPPSLRSHPMDKGALEQVYRWRSYFLEENNSGSPAENVPTLLPENYPGVVDASWLEQRLGRPGLKIIDTREQSEYNKEHIPGAVAIFYESVRSAVDGVPSLLLPGEILASHMAVAGITPSDLIVLVYGGDRFRDATIMAMALERLGHRQYAVLEGGYDTWKAENRKKTADLPEAFRSVYPAPQSSDQFTINARQLSDYLNSKNVTILDARPKEYFAGEKSDEARGGHIPGAVNRPYSEDLTASGLKSISELVAAYSRLIPDKDRMVVVHCRTGHQASQTFFILKHLLHYKTVYWYDGGWTEWAARSELPIQKGMGI